MLVVVWLAEGYGGRQGDALYNDLDFRWRLGKLIRSHAVIVNGLHLVRPCASRGSPQMARYSYPKAYASSRHVSHELQVVAAIAPAGFTMEGAMQEAVRYDDHDDDLHASDNQQMTVQ